MENSLLPAAKEWFGDEKEGWELHLLPRNFTHRLGPGKVVSWVASFELFKLVFVTEHHIAPILLNVGPGELQPTALVSFKSREVFYAV